jgi:molecular chaperone GrpE (heat shock protein)
MRATGYVAGKPGRVVEVARTGLAWHRHVLRKADVIVSEAPP